MNILIRADSSFSIGTGHIMRDLVLAESFPNANIVFAVRDLPGNINDKIVADGYRIELLQSDSVSELISLIISHRAETVILDHYDIGYNDEKQIKKVTSACLLVLDDTYEKHECDILLNHNIYAEAEKYIGLVPPSCEVRCGAKHTLLRNEFIEAKAKQANVRSKHKEITNVLIIMGGADVANLNTKIIEALNGFRNIKVIVVTTTANKNLSSLVAYIGRKKHILLDIDSSTIAKHMRSADLAICTPSVTLNELYFMKTPFIAIKIADNQSEMFNYLTKTDMPALAVFSASRLAVLLENELGNNKHEK